MKYSYTEFHEGPTNGLVTDIRSRTDGRTDGRTDVISTKALRFTSQRAFINETNFVKEESNPLGFYAVPTGKTLPMFRSTVGAFETSETINS
jgi:hypothetical protein